MTTNGVGFCRDELVDTDSGATRFVCSWHRLVCTGVHQGSSPWLVLATIKVALIHLHFHNMFITVTRRTSDAVANLMVSPILGVVLVEFANGYSYEYTNVSRRAIANLLLNPNMSLGFWVNQNCIAPERTECLTLQYVG